MSKLSEKAQRLMIASHTVHDFTTWSALYNYIAELEAFIEQLIEASENMSYAVQCEDDRDAESYFAWEDLVSKWRRMNGGEK